MNWYLLYKNSGLMDDIQKYGPSGEEPIDQNDPKWQQFKHDRMMRNYYRREQFMKQYGYGVPSQEAIEKIKEFVGNGTVLEVGSGTGMWAKLLQDAGVAITATDNFSWSNKMQSGKYTEVENLGHAEAIQKYHTHDVLMMVWPLYDDPMANEALKAFKGNRLIFVGEGQGGCTGDDSFFCTLDEEWENTGSVCIPQWHYIHDCLELYTRK